jgi:PadR family transcriptional regulator, regulatory protein PadR
MNHVQGDKLRGHLESVVLAVLERGPAHGFEIMQRLDGASRGALQLKEGTLYPVLYRLEKQGYLLGAWDESNAPKPGPRRRIYKLTKSGKKQLAKHRAEWQHFVETIGGIVGATWNSA